MLLSKFSVCSREKILTEIRMAKEEKKEDQLRSILKRHVFGKGFRRFNTGLANGVFEVHVSPDQVDPVREGLAKFFAGHMAHPLKDVRIGVKGNEAYRPTPKFNSCNGRSLRYGDGF
jgi:hypothetical protein